MPHRLSELGLFLATMLFLPLVAQGQELALRGATVHTAAGQPVENATILIRDGGSPRWAGRSANHSSTSRWLSGKR
ncbi:MAG: hypothetical protein H0V06_00200 [Gemmatimonadetes bacterium]|nr:hypothetical protein [Gemmatimonadota bacterium]